MPSAGAKQKRNHFQDFGGRGGPAFTRAGGLAAKSVLQGASGVVAQLALAINDVERGDIGLSGLGPLGSRHSRGEVASVLKAPMSSNFPRGPFRAFASFEQPANTSSARNDDVPPPSPGGGTHIGDLGH